LAAKGSARWRRSRSRLGFLLSARH
jgi:hypothetical protein